MMAFKLLTFGILLVEWLFGFGASLCSHKKVQTLHGMQASSRVDVLPPVFEAAKLSEKRRVLRR